MDDNVELGYVPLETLMNSSSEYISRFAYISDPSKPDSDGDGLKDPVDARPLKKYDQRFEKSPSLSYIQNNEAVDELQLDSDRTYNTVSQTGRHNRIKAKAYINVLGGNAFMKMPNASSFLKHFLSDTGTLYEFNAKEVVEDTNNGYKNFTENMDQIMSLCEETIVNKLCFSTKSSTNLVATSFSKTGADNETNEKIARDWWYSIGNSSASMTFECEKNHGTYRATVNYYILDFYDWEEGSKLKGGLVADGEMYELHTAGIARQFSVRGLYTVIIEWSEGQRISNGANIIN